MKRPKSVTIGAVSYEIDPKDTVFSLGRRFEAAQGRGDGHSVPVIEAKLKALKSYEASLVLAAK